MYIEHSSLYNVLNMNQNGICYSVATFYHWQNVAQLQDYLEGI